MCNQKALERTIRSTCVARETLKGVFSEALIADIIGFLTVIYMLQNLDFEIVSNTIADKRGRPVFQ